VGFPGLEASRAFVVRGAAEYRGWVERSSLQLDPMGYLPGRASAYVGNGARAPDPGPDRTVFHTDYLWLGAGRRSFEAVVHPPPDATLDGVELELRVHRYATLGRVELDCPASAVLRCEGARPARSEIRIEPDPAYCYALLGQLRATEASFRAVEVSNSPGPDLAAPPAH
jgi:hypothetical protein